MIEKQYKTKDNKIFSVRTYFNKTSISDNLYIRENLTEIWNLLLSAYNNVFLGYQSKKDLIKKSIEVKLGYYNDNLISVAVYNDYKDGKKCVGIGATRENNFLHELGKFSIIEILSDDFEFPEKWYWCEASGKIEELCYKTNAIHIPTDFVSYILGNKDVSILDEYHYLTTINNCIEEKSMFGTKNKDVLDRVTKYLNDRHNWIKEFEENNTIIENIQYPRYHSEPEKIKGILDFFCEWYDDLCLDDLDSILYNKFKENIIKLRTILKTNPNVENKRNLVICYNKSIDVFKHINKFKLHEIKRCKQIK